MKNKTQRRIHKYFFSHYFVRIFPQNLIRGNAVTTNTPNEGEKKNHRGKSRKSKRFNNFDELERQRRRREHRSQEERDIENERRILIFY
jgi:hypothetical protein